MRDSPHVHSSLSGYGMRRNHRRLVVRPSLLHTLLGQHYPGMCWFLF